MASTSSVAIEDKVLKSLEGSRFESVALQKITEGNVNWSYVAKLCRPLDDGTEEALIKHGENFMSSKPDFALTLTRCVSAKANANGVGPRFRHSTEADMQQRVEEEVLKRLSGCSSFGSGDSGDAYHFRIRTAEALHFDEENANLVQEYLPNSINLKQYVLQYYSSQTPASFEPQCRQLGKAVGAWLKGYVEWSTKQVELRKVVAENGFAQEVKRMLNFGFLRGRVDQFPALLGHDKNIFDKLEQMAEVELQDQSQLQIVHGDLAPGNVILPNVPMEEGVDIPIFIIDWECTQLGVLSVDFGEMVGELYALRLYKSVPAGLWIMEGFVAAYGHFSEDFAFRAAIQIGTHLLCVTPASEGWGTPDQIQGVARVGRDVIVHAWKRDRLWFETSDLACLFKAAV
ncbi:uncharacterized protein E0L32_004054 [Thyridium curvatum]|uniref:non-specific serine/threonine protein kinase n=1 Tax=Thyridium curvatum TaxID=1093900 RepID=A0A507AZY7_9PEZI|nr:uncharacterized protein E0L32_004054 [Thyridium curvatum]TPX16405.1 hypothetical protein E0L32_004054 [Thyridium curvatum]